jgi:hypothetical protein
MNAWRFERAEKCTTPTGQSAHGTYVTPDGPRVYIPNGHPAPPGMACAFCGLPLTERLKPVVIGGGEDVSWYTARETARAVFHTDQLESEPTEEPPEIALHWEGSDMVHGGSPRGRRLVVEEE